MSLKPGHVFGIMLWGAAAYGVAVLGTWPGEPFGNTNAWLSGPWFC